MRLKISTEIFSKFPNLNIGVVIAKNVDNTGTNEEIKTFLTNSQKDAAEKFADAALAEHPKIAPWRAAYSSFGAKPKKYKCSVEALIKRAVSREFLPNINKIVDIYNTLSLKHVLPMGGDDLDKIEGDIKLKFADGSERFVPLGKEEAETPHSGEIVYADSKDILCRRWNWRECDKTKLTPDSKNVILYTEGLPPVTNEEVEAAINELEELVSKYCNGAIEKHILNSEKQEIEIK